MENPYITFHSNSYPILIGDIEYKLENCNKYLLLKKEALLELYKKRYVNHFNSMKYKIIGFIFRDKMADLSSLSEEQFFQYLENIYGNHDYIPALNQTLCTLKRNLSDKVIFGEDYKFYKQIASLLVGMNSNVNRQVTGESVHIPIGTYRWIYGTN